MVGAIDRNRSEPDWRLRAVRVHRPYLVVCLVALTSCATASTHQFTQPARDWQTRTGQLLYRNPKTTVIGDVIVRFSRNGGFELTFSKGPGVNLLFLRQDSSFAEVIVPLAGRGRTGSRDRGRAAVRSWLGMLDSLSTANDCY